MFTSLRPSTGLLWTFIVFTLCDRIAYNKLFLIWKIDTTNYDNHYNQLQSTVSNFSSFVFRRINIVHSNDKLLYRMPYGVRQLISTYMFLTHVSSVTTPIMPSCGILLHVIL